MSTLTSKGLPDLLHMRSFKIYTLISAILKFSALIFGSLKREVLSADTKRDLGEAVCFIQRGTFNLLCLICRSLKFIELFFHLIALTSAQGPLPMISQDHMLMQDPASLLLNQPAHVIASQHYSLSFLTFSCAI